MDLRSKRSVVLRRSSKESESGKEFDADYVPPYQVECSFRKAHLAKKSTNPEVLVKIPKRRLGDLNKLWDPNYDAQRDADKCRFETKNLESVVNGIRSKYFNSKANLNPHLLTHLTKSSKNENDKVRHHHHHHQQQQHLQHHQQEQQQQQQQLEKIQDESRTNGESSAPEMTNNNQKEPAVRRAHFKKEFIRQHSRPNEIYPPPDHNNVLTNGHGSECHGQQSEAVQKARCFDPMISDTGHENFRENSSEFSGPMQTEQSAMKGTSSEVTGYDVQVKENQLQAAVGKHNLPTTIVNQQRSRVALPLKIQAGIPKLPDQTSQPNSSTTPTSTGDIQETQAENQGFQYPSIVTHEAHKKKMSDLNRQYGSHSYDMHFSDANTPSANQHTNLNAKQCNATESMQLRQESLAAAAETNYKPNENVVYPQSANEPGKNVRRRFSEASYGQQRPKSPKRTRNRKSLDSQFTGNMLPPMYCEYPNRNYRQPTTTTLNQYPKFISIPVTNSDITTMATAMYRTNVECGSVAFRNVAQHIIPVYAPQHPAIQNQYNPYMMNGQHQMSYPQYPILIPRQYEDFMNNKPMPNPEVMMPARNSACRGNVIEQYFIDPITGETKVLRIPLFDNNHQHSPANFTHHFRQQNFPNLQNTQLPHNVENYTQQTNPRLQQCNNVEKTVGLNHVQTNISAPISKGVSQCELSVRDKAPVNINQTNDNTTVNSAHKDDQLDTNSAPKFAIHLHTIGYRTTGYVQLTFHDLCILLDMLLNRIKWAFDNILNTIDTDHHSTISIKDYWRQEGYFKFKLYLTDLIIITDEIKGLNTAIYAKYNSDANSRVTHTDEFTRKLEGFIRHSSAILTVEMNEKLIEEYMMYCKDFFDKYLDELYFEHKRKYTCTFEKILAENIKLQNLKAKIEEEHCNDRIKIGIPASTNEAASEINRKRKISPGHDDIDESALKLKKMVECATQTIQGRTIDDKVEIILDNTNTKCARDQIQEEAKSVMLTSSNIILNECNDEVKIINSKTEMNSDDFNIIVKPSNVRKGSTSTQNNYITIMQCPNGPSIRIASNKCSCGLKASIHSICENKEKNLSTINLIQEIQSSDVICANEKEATESTSKFKIHKVSNSNFANTPDNTKKLEVIGSDIETNLEYSIRGDLSDGLNIKDLSPFISRAIKAEYLAEFLNENSSSMKIPTPNNDIHLTQTKEHKGNSVEHPNCESDSIIIDCETYKPKHKKRKNSNRKRQFDKKKSSFVDNKEEVIVIDSDEESDFIVIDGNESSNDDAGAKKSAEENVIKENLIRNNTDTVASKNDEMFRAEICEKSKIIASDRNYRELWETKRNNIPTTDQIRTGTQEYVKPSQVTNEDKNNFKLHAVPKTGIDIPAVNDKNNLKLQAASISNSTQTVTNASITNSDDRNNIPNIAAQQLLIRSNSVISDKTDSNIEVPNSRLSPGSIESLDKSSVVKYIARVPSLVEANSIQGLINSSFTDSQNKPEEKSTCTSVKKQKEMVIVSNTSLINKNFPQQQSFPQPRILETILREPPPQPALPPVTGNDELNKKQVLTQHVSNVHFPYPNERDSSNAAQKVLVRNSIINLVNKKKNAPNTCIQSMNTIRETSTNSPQSVSVSRTSSSSNDTNKCTDGEMQHQTEKYYNAPVNSKYQISNTDVTMKQIGHRNYRSPSEEELIDHYAKISSNNNVNMLGMKIFDNSAYTKYKNYNANRDFRNMLPNDIYPLPDSSISPQQTSEAFDVIHNPNYTLGEHENNGNGNSILKATLNVDRGGMGIVHQIHGLKVKHHLTPEEYVEEVKATDRMDIPMEFKRFYNYVTKQQILQQANPVSFKLFLELLNNGGLQDFHKKYIEYQRKREADLTRGGLVTHVAESVPKYKTV